MKKFGLIGFPLTHSFSEKYFSEKFAKDKINDCSYNNFLLKNLDDFTALVKSIPELAGLNITIPYKQKIIPFLDKVDDEAKIIGAVNTIKIQHSASGNLNLTGYNTDVYGFEKSLHPLLKKTHRKALVLGSGGGAKAVEFVLKKSGIEFLMVSRGSTSALLAPSITYENLNEKIMNENLLIINTTPLGMFPDTTRFPPIPYEFISSKHLLYDLVYNPEQTIFLKRGKEQGAKIKNGLEMLQLQAEKSWEIWNG